MHKEALGKFNYDPTTAIFASYKLNRIKVRKVIKKDCLQKYVSKLNSATKPKRVWEITRKRAETIPVKYLSINYSP